MDGHIYESLYLVNRKNVIVDLYLNKEVPLSKKIYRDNKILIGSDDKFFIVEEIAHKELPLPIQGLMSKYVNLNNIINEL